MNVNFVKLAHVPHFHYGHFSVDGHLGRFQCLAILNRAVVTMDGQLSL